MQFCKFLGNEMGITLFCDIIKYFNFFGNIFVTIDLSIIEKYFKLSN